MKKDNTNTPRFWRIRMNLGKYIGRQEECALEQGKVGIWYGGWDAKDWYSAKDDGEKRMVIKESKFKGRRFRPNDFNTAKRFDGIKQSDWVVIFKKIKGQADDVLCLYHIHGRMKSDSKSTNLFPLILPEIFKYKKIVPGSKKEFHLSKLPPQYRLISSAGRANVYQFRDTYQRLLKILADSEDEDEANEKIKSMPFMEWIDMLGPAGWESLCEGYLIFKENFVPTGLLTGRTLYKFDILGRNYKNKKTIVAQCKKDSAAVLVPKEFVEECKNIREDDKYGALCYFFTYGGYKSKKPLQSWLKVVTGDDIKKWTAKGVGSQYAHLWRM